MKILTAILMAALLSKGVAAEEPGQAAGENAWKTRMFTVEELKKYNGRDGMPAYAAVDGIVYDFSRSRTWKNGQHMKLHSAGTDLSSELHNKAPKLLHKDGKILEKIPKVGVFAGAIKENTAAAPPAEPGQAAPQQAAGLNPAVPPQAAEPKPAAPRQEVKAPLAALHKVTKEELGLETACPVTGEKIKVSEKTPALDFKGKTYYFSGLSSLEKFSRDPASNLKEKAKNLFKKKKS